MRAAPNYALYLPPVNHDIVHTQREVEILERTFLSDKSIADDLCISYHTVKSHIKNIKKKTGCVTTRTLVYYATKKGYIN